MSKRITNIKDNITTNIKDNKQVNFYNTFVNIFSSTKQEDIEEDLQEQLENTAREYIQPSDMKDIQQISQETKTSDSLTTISKEEALDLAKYFNINLDVVDFDDWFYGLNVETEHDNKISKLTNITKGDKTLIAKIAIAHLTENVLYYKFLKKMEQDLDMIKRYTGEKNIFKQH